MAWDVDPAPQAFAPEGINVNFVQVVDADTIRMRTYERGVEAETLACGTGSVASAIDPPVSDGHSLPVAVQVRSGATLLVHLDGPPECRSRT